MGADKASGRNEEMVPYRRTWIHPRLGVLTEESEIPKTLSNNPLWREAERRKARRFRDQGFEGEEIEKLRGRDEMGDVEGVCALINEGFADALREPRPSPSKGDALTRVLKEQEKTNAEIAKTNADLSRLTRNLAQATSGVGGISNLKEVEEKEALLYL